MVSPLILSLKKQKSLSNSKVRILSPAKINLYLNIVGKYPNNFHRIQSIIERISLFDTLDITVTENPALKLYTKHKGLANKDNLVIKAIELMRKRYHIPFGFRIRLDKKIPVGSGLGGGSSNAASTLLALGALFDLKLDQKTLNRLGATLGSDVNFFLAQKPFALVFGRGEKVTPLDIDTKLIHFIIWIKKSVSTKQVYSLSKPKLTKVFNNANILKYALKHKDIFLIQKNIFNVLEGPACQVSKELAAAKRYLTSKQIFAKVTGSGSALYTLEASLSLAKFKDRLPSSWRVFKVETF